MNFKSFYLVIGPILGILITVGNLIVSFHHQLIFSSSKSQYTFLRHQFMPEVLFKQANKMYLEGNLILSKELTVKALKNNPLYVPALILLAKIYKTLNEHKKASDLTQYIHSLTKEISMWRWEETLLTYLLGLTDFTSEDINYLMQYVPHKRINAIRLAYAIWPDIKELINHIKKENLPYFFKYSLYKGKLINAKELWQYVNASPLLMDKNIKLDFIDKLWRSDDIDFAVKLWRQYFDKQHILHNGDFSEPILNKAFGWRATSNKYLRSCYWNQEMSDDENYIHIGFLGAENIRFNNFYQILPIEPGKYIFSGYWKAQNLTTDERPFFLITGIKCKMKAVRFSMVPSDIDWTKFEYFFEAPPECKLIRLSIFRRQSFQIDSRIAGDFYIKNLAISSLHQESANE